jgi:hypothetical protein
MCPYSTGAARGGEPPWKPPVQDSPTVALPAPAPSGIHLRRPTPGITCRTPISASVYFSVVGQGPIMNRFGPRAPAVIGQLSMVFGLVAMLATAPLGSPLLATLLVQVGGAVAIAVFVKPPIFCLR